MPVIASLNGKSLGGWIDYAKRIEEALVRHHELHEQKKEQFNKTQSEAINVSWFQQDKFDN